MTQTRPLRADAERNRARILEAAGQLFAERGLDVSMEQIAAAADVGVGTLYRRFADRTALIDALFEEKGDELAGYAREALEDPDPWTALTGFMRNVCASHARDRGLKEALMSSGHGTETLARIRDRIRPIAEQLVDRAKEAGALRSDLATFDVPMMNFAMGYLAELTRTESPQFYERILTILFDGMAASREDTTPMPPEASALTPDQFARSLSRP
jgi:AcrR family transcriptional regulator